MERMKRTVTCGELTGSDKGREVVLNGWVHRNRDHGGIHFINLRDRYGITQVVIDEDAEQSLKDKTEEIKFEFCIAVKGVVRTRPESMRNPDMATGDIEVAAADIQILSKCETLPFVLEEKSNANEDLRLEYRYLDLRTASMQRNIRLRHMVTLEARKYLGENGFYEIETPTLIRSTPEGARDFLVPSRLHTGKFYALPQSPQLYKQLLMVSGFDRYFQIAHCFRDEDPRGDRQLEHSQIDMEMSFVSKEDIFEIVEGMFASIFKNTLDIELKTPFARLGYQDAMDLYGSDKPDLRYEIKMQDFAPYAEKSDFGVFKKVLEDGGSIKALVAEGCNSFSRKNIDELERIAKQYGAKGLAWMKVKDGTLDGGVGRFFADQADSIKSGLGAKDGDLILMVADKWKTACTALGAVRSELGKMLKLADPNVFTFAWIVDFPLFEYNEERNGWDPAHHMFTMPQEQYLENMEEDPGAVKGDLYDLVCNGVELASGSIRIHDPEIQRRVFQIIGITEEDVEERFSFLLKAFQYGAPPHGGIAPGLDRLVMLMAGEPTIREVIAFPKNTQGISAVDMSPAYVGEEQLNELNIQLRFPDFE